MSKPVAGLVDYDMGNLKSVSKALEKVGLNVRPVDDPKQMRNLDALVLPGVGSFRVAVKNLRSRKLFSPVREWIRSEKPFLGICLGYQLLFERGKEGGSEENGLGIFKGKVQKFSASKNLKVPHMGWNRVRRSNSPQAKVIFKGIPDGSYFYFVHSYFPVPRDGRIVAGKTAYGKNFSSCIAWDNSFACQFHPEKSGDNGLKLLKNFSGNLQAC